MEGPGKANALRPWGQERRAVHSDQPVLLLNSNSPMHAPSPQQVTDSIPKFTSFPSSPREEECEGTRRENRQARLRSLVSGAQRGWNMERGFLEGL